MIFFFRYLEEARGRVPECPRSVVPLTALMTDGRTTGTGHEICTVIFSNPHNRRHNVTVYPNSLKVLYVRTFVLKRDLSCSSYTEKCNFAAPS